MNLTKANKLEKVVQFILEHFESVEVYGYANLDGFHYKSFWMTPYGCLNLDTGSTLVRTVKDGREIVKNYGKAMKRYKSREILRSWEGKPLYFDRKVEKQILAKFAAYEDSELL